EATLERFPTAPRRLEWEDPNAQATDRVGRWEGYASEGGAYDTASVAERRAPGVAGKRRRAARDEMPAVPAAALAASVPLFEDQPYQPTPTVADVAGEPTHAVTTPGTVAAALYLDALFTGAFTPEEGTAASEGGLAVPVPSSGRPHAAAQTEQRRLFLARRPQRYTEDYALEDDYGLEAAGGAARPRDALAAAVAERGTSAQATRDRPRIRAPPPQNPTQVAGGRYPPPGPRMSAALGGRDAATSH